VGITTGPLVAGQLLRVVSTLSRENKKDEEPFIVGGASVCTMLKKSKNILDVEGSLFTRFTNLVVPIGLQLHPVGADEDKDANEMDMEIQSIDIKKFDHLFYSVGKDLGISKERTYKNRTMKNPTK
jgi:hypothetical protein